jgi:DNA-binding transcriptional LysR family regulator
LAADHEALKLELPKLRRIITHDTSVVDITRSEGLSREGQKIYVQNMDQKVEAVLAGIGIGHLPRKRIQGLLDDGLLAELSLGEVTNSESFMAWKISNKGRGLQALSRLLAAARW